MPERFQIGVNIFLCQQGALMVPGRCHIGGNLVPARCQGEVVSLCHYSANIEDLWCHYSAKCVEEVWCQEGASGMWCPGAKVWCPPGVNVTQEQKDGTAQGSGILVPGT